MQWYWGLLQLSFIGYVVAALILTHITIASVTIYLHRHQAHRSVDLHPIPSHFFRFWLWLTTGMRTIEWVAVHRKHHAFTEKEGDPHSPQVYGIKKVLWEGAELYHEAAKDKPMLEKYGAGTPNDWVEHRLYKMGRIGIVSMLFIDLLLFGIPGIAIWGVQMIWIPFFAAGVINGIGHYWGYRNYESSDAARNIVPWGILIGGEELHNNHHAFASSARLSNKWWEFDIGYFYIRLLSLVGLAKVKRLAPKLLNDPAKATIDYDTIKAFVSNRIQVMARYGKQVIAPISRRWLGLWSKGLLLRDKALLSKRARNRLAYILRSERKVRTVYVYRKRLQKIWDNMASVPPNDGLQRLQQWCKNAETSGIEALRQFSYYLKGLVPS